MVTVRDIFEQNLKEKKACKAYHSAETKYTAASKASRDLREEYREAALPVNVIFEQDGKKYFFDGYSFTEING